MFDRNVEQILKNLGFSQNETSVYLALLELGQARVQEIARKSGLKRTTMYPVLEYLKHRGLVASTKVGVKTHYFAEPPEKLVENIRSYQEQLEAALPALQATYNKHNVKPKVMFFEGLEGIKSIYEDTIREKPEVILEYTTDNIYKFLPTFPLYYLDQRRACNIRAKRLAPRSPQWYERKRHDTEDLSETILLDRSQYDPQIEINIYNHKVAFMSYRDQIGLIIESTDIADVMRKSFELAWERAKEMTGTREDARSATRVV